MFLFAKIELNVKASGDIIIWDIKLKISYTVTYTILYTYIHLILIKVGFPSIWAPATDDSYAYIHIW